MTSPILPLISETGQLCFPDGSPSIYSTDIPETQPRWRRDQLQLKIRGDINWDFQTANFNAKFGRARQDGRAVGYTYVDQLAGLPQARRLKAFRRNQRIDQGRF